MKNQSRKIIQIAISPDKELDFIYALCNDGTIWVIVIGVTGELEWIQLPAIPQSMDDQ